MMGQRALGKFLSNLVEGVGWNVDTFFGLAGVVFIDHQSVGRTAHRPQYTGQTVEPFLLIDIELVGGLDQSDQIPRRSSHIQLRPKQ